MRKAPRRPKEVQVRMRHLQVNVGKMLTHKSVFVACNLLLLCNHLPGSADAHAIGRLSSKYHAIRRWALEEDRSRQGSAPLAPPAPETEAAVRQGLLATLALPALLLALPSMLPGLLLLATLSPAITVVRDAVGELGGERFNEIFHRVTSSMATLTGGLGGTGEEGTLPKPAGALLAPPRPSASNIVPLVADASGALLPHSTSGTQADVSHSSLAYPEKGMFSGINVLLNQVNAQQGSNGLLNVVTTTVGQAARELLNEIKSMLDEITNFKFRGLRQRMSKWSPFKRRHMKQRVDRRSRSMGNLLRQVFRTIKEGIRKYEISEPECRQRLICDINQNVLTQTFKSYANPLLANFNLESHLKSSEIDLSSNAKSEIQKLFAAAKTGLSDDDCAATYSRCQVAFAVEPNGNSLLNNLIKRRAWNQRF